MSCVGVWAYIYNCTVTWQWPYAVFHPQGDAHCQLVHSIMSLGKWYVDESFFCICNVRICTILVMTVAKI